MERFFTAVTGEIEINKKNQNSYTTISEDTPKFFFTTNHSFNGMNNSMRARMFNTAFSDWYTADHAPIDDFGKSFFQDWDFAEWNAFYNLMAEAIHLYFKFGLVECPQEQIERRRQRQFIGEEFLSWFVAYFDATGHNINRRIRRSDMFDDCVGSSQQLKRYTNQVMFLRKLKACIDYSRLQYNPHKFDEYSNPGHYDKAGGVEYIVVANADFDINTINDGTAIGPNKPNEDLPY